jgi:hypothetical protein
MKKVVYKAENGWVYDILTPIGDLLIRQNTKPAVGGTNGFASKEDAEHIADLVIALMDEGLSPSVTVAQVTKAKTIDIISEIKAKKEEIAKAKTEAKPNKP